MSADHADTIRPRIRHERMVNAKTFAHPPDCAGCKAEAALDTLLAERQQAIDALREGLGRTEQLIDEYAEEGEPWVLSHLGTIRGVLDRAQLSLGGKPR